MWASFEVLLDDCYHLDHLTWDADRSASIRVLDVGAHVGSFALAVATRYSTASVLCFEPAPDDGLPKN